MNVPHEVPARRQTPNASSYLNGESPSERGEKKRRRALEWIHRWGYTSPDILRQVVGQAASGYSSKLSRAGLLVESRTQAGGVQKGVPKTVLTLSTAGLQEAERFSAQLLRYRELDPGRINQHLLRHNILAQQLTLNAMKSGSGNDFMTERMLDHTGDKKDEKKPDVIWSIDGARKLFAVEIELTAKWGRDLDDFVLKVCRALDARQGAPKYDRFIIASDSPAIIERYKAALSTGTNFTLWRYDAHAKKYLENGSRHVPDWVPPRVTFEQVGRP